MTLTIDMPDEVADRARAVAQSRGLDLPTFAVAAMIEVTDAEDDGEETDEEIIAIGREAVEDIRAGRLYSLEEVDGRVEAALASARQSRAAVATP